MVILSKSCPSALLHPIVKDTKTKSLLLAMAKLAKKVSGKIKISSCKSMLKIYTTQSGGGGVNWDEVPVLTALQSWQIAKQAVYKWGDCKWEQRWSNLGSCNQTKIWFPVPRRDISQIIRRLSRIELSRLIHFITGHNHLLRHRNLLNGGGIGVGSVEWKGRIPSTCGLYVKLQAA